MATPRESTPGSAVSKSGVAADALPPQSIADDGASRQQRPAGFEMALEEIRRVRAEMSTLLSSEKHRRAGFRRGDDSLIKRADGSYNAEEVLRGTHYECYHCGSAWRDTPETRRQLDHSSYYVAENPNAARENVGFSWPVWAGQRIAWGKIMLEYLEAKAALDRFGNIEPLKQWYQKRAAISWNPGLATRRETVVAAASYDPNEAIPGEVARDMMIDCQQDQDHFVKTGKSITGWFWYVVRAYDRLGNSKMLARGYAKSWDTLREVQAKWKILNERVGIDIDKWPAQIMGKVAEFREVKEVKAPPGLPWLNKKTSTWYLMAAENPKSQLYRNHRDRKLRAWSPEESVLQPVVDADTGKLIRIGLKKVRFAKRTFQLHLDAIRSGADGMPKFEVLSRKFLDALTQEMETGNRTYDKQMDAQYYSEERKEYVERHPDDHYSWCEQALLVRQAMDGLFGHVTVFASEANTDVSD